MTTRCSKCAAELPDGMRFCGACGTELIPRCAACGTPAALAQQRFCGNCGAALQPLMPPPRERRLVSVLFCDLVGFTTFSESHDHEDVRDMLQQYFAAARRIIAGYGGTIEKFIGDAVMAVWGAPVAREDDAERSVRAALDLTTAVESLAERLSIPELQVRVGLLTGEAAVDIGGVQEGMVIGDAVNTAARIQSLAPPGSVLVDDTTRLVCESAIEFQAAGAHPVNGRSEPVRTWRAVRVLARPGGIRPAGAVEPPFVGRQAELATIRAALDGLLSPDARIRLVTVTGEAGTGKSRLARELERLAGGYAIEAPIRWHRGRAARFGEGAGLSALQEIVRMQAGITHDDDAERQRSLVEELLMSHLAAESGERDPVRRALHRLLDLDDGTEPIEPGELFSGWRVLWERLAGDGPVVMVCEELQSAGQALLDFVEHLLEWSPEAPILLLALSRPDDRVEALATMGERVALAPLTGDEMDQLVRGAVRDPPSPLLDAVRADGGGVPLYAVESLRALADRGVLVAEQGRYTVRGELDEIAVPPTIRALVASRLDRLGGLERKALTAGAVLGERFSAAAAAALSGLDPADADALLDGLVVKAILTLDRDPRSPLRGRYAFLQGVVRRVALDTLSRRDRKRLHLAAADHLSPEAAGSEATAARAGHLLAAVDADPGADDAKALRRRAGSALGDAADRAAAVGSLTEALAFLDRATELEADEQGRAVLLERAGAVAHRSGDAAAAAARYHAAADAHAAAGRVGEQHAARAHELRSLRYTRPPRDLLPQLRVLDAALASGRDAASALTAAVLSFTLYQSGDHEEALQVASRAIEVAQACGADGELLQALGAQASALAELGRPDDAIEVYRRALDLAADRDRRRAVHLTGNLAVSLASIGRYAEAVEGARQTIAGAERMGERFVERWGRLVLGRALCSLGDWSRAGAEIEAVKDAVPPFQVGMAIAPLAVIALGRGDRSRARELVDEHDRRCGKDASVFESDFRSLRAAVLACQRDDLDALAAVIPASEVADFAEWAGWLPPVVDLLVPRAPTAALTGALAALRLPEPMRRTPPVLAQTRRLEAHLAWRVGDLLLARDRFDEAESLAAGCGLAFEAAVIALERSEASGDAAAAEGLARVQATFAQLGATPWSRRAARVGTERVAESPRP